MRTRIGLRISLLLIGPLIASGCASVSGGRPAYVPRLRTVTSIGDKPLSAVAGTPGASVAAGDDIPEPRLAADGQISGRVYDERGRPAPGVEVRVAMGGDAAGRLVRARTDDAGGFTLHGLRSGAQYTLVAESDDGARYLVGKTRATAGARRVEIALANPDARGPAGPRVRTASDAQPADGFGDPDGDEGPSRVNDDDLPPAVEAEALLPRRRGRSRSGEDAAAIATATGSRWRTDEVEEIEPPAPHDGVEPAEPRFEERDPLPPARERPRPPAADEVPPPPEDRPAASHAEDVAPSEARPDPVPAFDPPADAAPVNPPPIPPVDRPAPPPIPEAEPRGGAAAPASTPAPPSIPDLAGEPPPAQPAPSPTPAAAPVRPIVSPASPAAVDPPIIPDDQPAGPATDGPAAAPVEPPAPTEPAPAEVIPPPASTESAPAAGPEAAPVPVADAPAVVDPQENGPAPAEAEGIPDVVEPPAAEPATPATEDTSAPPPIAPPSEPDAAPPEPAPTEAPTEPAPTESAAARTDEPVRRPTWGEVAARAQAQPPAPRARPARPATAGIRGDGMITCEFDAKNQRLLDFSLPDLRGRSVRLKEIDSDLILLDFWGTWCDPCVRSIPHLVALQKRFGERRIQVVGVACEQGPAASRAARVADAARKLGINYLVAFGGEAEGELSPIQRALNVQVYPTMILIDRQGRILWREQGSTAQTLARLDRVVASNFAGDVIRR